MTWHERLTVLILIGVFAAGYTIGCLGRWEERVTDRRRARLVERRRAERYAEVEQECHDIIVGRIEAYGVLGQRDSVRVEHRPHLRGVW